MCYLLCSCVDDPLRVALFLVFSIGPGPRGPPKDTPPSVARAVGSTGYYLVSPLRCADGRVVLVNRGWFPTTVMEGVSAPGNRNPPPGGLAKLREGAVAPVGSAQAPVVAILRPAEEVSSTVTWTSASGPSNVLMSFDAPKLASMTGSPASESAPPLPLFDVVSDATASASTGSAPLLPLTKQPSAFLEFYVMPFNHLVYTVTWYSLCIAGVFLTRRLLRKKVPAPPMPKEF